MVVFMKAKLHLLVVIMFVCMLVFSEALPVTLPARRYTDNDQLVLWDMALHELVKLEISDEWNLTLVTPEQWRNKSMELYMYIIFELAKKNDNSEMTEDHSPALRKGFFILEEFLV